MSRRTPNYFPQIAQMDAESESANIRAICGQPNAAVHIQFAIARNPAVITMTPKHGIGKFSEKIQRQRLRFESCPSGRTSPTVA
jgi:hypothetical protein